MKKHGYVLMAAVMAFGLAGCGDPCKENFLTKMGDNIATLGKGGAEKDRVLMERAAERAGKCAESKAGEMKKKMGF